MNLTTIISKINHIYNKFGFQHTYKLNQTSPYTLSSTDDFDDSIKYIEEIPAGFTIIVDEKHIDNLKFRRKLEMLENECTSKNVPFIIEW